ncbi:MAG: ATP-dependent DNA ligase [Chloroflexi bacterium]|nr:ATP-dependent DNA ligase [Chloroflexota bacterium]
MPARKPTRSLDEYEAKRDFEKTPEPPPDAAREPSAGAPLTFVVQQHRATRMHYDLRLEVGGAMPSWPVPRGPSLDPAERRLAIQTEDHPLGYASFEGVIPKGEYGAGEVIVWDDGTYSPDEDGALSFHDRAEAEARVLKGIAAGKLSVTLRGRKLKGSWALVRTSEEERSWLLIKHRDEAADPSRDLVAEDQSVISGLAIADLQAGRLPDPARRGTPPDLAALPPAERGELPRELAPMQAALADGPFDGKDWLFEPKLDGIRALAFIEDGAVTLRSRRGLDVSAQYPGLVQAIAAQPVASAILDGEIVALDEHGAPSFERLQQRMNLSGEVDIALADAELPVLFLPFDLLYLDGFDLRRVPLADRIEVLARVLRPGPLLQPVQTFEADGHAAYEAAVGLGFEGVIAKRRDGAYLDGRRSQEWLKVKARRTTDLVVGGWREGESGRGSFGALLLGVHDEDGALRYAGRVGSGFNDRALGELRARLDALAADDDPFSDAPPEPGRLHFVRPELVAEVEFANWTNDERLRAPVFVRLRDDKPPSEVLRANALAAPPPVIEAPAAADRRGDAVADVLEQLGREGERLHLGVGGRELAVTNLDKVLWPETAQQRALTKRDLLRYLAEVSPWLLPHLRDRPLTLTRYPNGIEGGSFYQKHYENPPPFVETVTVYTDSASGDQQAILCNNLPTLLWLGQLADLELHISLARVSPQPDGAHLEASFSGSKARVEASLLNYPDFVLFDLDPYIYAGSEQAGDEPELNRRAFAKTVEVARGLKELLDAASLSSFVKTSGATGLHILVPVLRQFDYAAVRSVAETFGGFLQRAQPRDVTLEWAVDKRGGKIFLDVNQNARIKNLVAAFSPRPKPGAPVSMPLRWAELDEVYPTDFTILTAPARIAEVGDPWADILAHKHDLAALLGAQ